MFFEIHPQLWGRGIMKEAFEEVVRFAMEDVGCSKLKVCPLCLPSGEERLTSSVIH
jgi:RimJ/RimL family protein N-acetyltransferase